MYGFPRSQCNDVGMPPADALKYLPCQPCSTLYPEVVDLEQEDYVILPADSSTADHNQQQPSVEEDQHAGWPSPGSGSCSSNSGALSVDERMTETPPENVYRHLLKSTGIISCGTRIDIGLTETENDTCRPIFDAEDDGNGVNFSAPQFTGPGLDLQPYNHSSFVNDNRLIPAPNDEQSMISKLDVTNDGVYEEEDDDEIEVVKVLISPPKSAKVTATGLQQPDLFSVDYQTRLDHMAEAIEAVATGIGVISCFEFLNKNRRQPVDCPNGTHKAIDYELEKTLHHKLPYQNPYRCSVCDKIFPSLPNAQRHLRIHTNAKPLECNICGLRIIEENARICHMLQTHTDGKTACVSCDVEHASLRELRVHMIKKHTIRHRIDTYECHMCKTVFPTADEMESHYCEPHSEEINENNVSSFLSNRSLKQQIQKKRKMKHGKIVYKESKFNVKTSPIVRVANKIKNRYMFKLSEMRKRKLAKSEDKVVKCEECGAMLSSHNLRTHLQSHRVVPEKESGHHECAVCREVFPSFSRLKLHATRHQGKAPCFCTICHKIYNNISSMLKHRYTEHSFDEWRYTCTTCHAVLDSDLAVHRHATEHRVDALNLFACPVCGKLINGYGGMTRHIRTVHTGEQPYKCTLCSFATGDNSITLKHMRKCNEGSTIQIVCTMCCKSFDSSVKYSIHLSTHESIRCWQCETKFDWCYFLRLHYRNCSKLFTNEGMANSFTSPPLSVPFMSSDKVGEFQPSQSKLVSGDLLKTKDHIQSSSVGEEDKSNSILNTPEKVDVETGQSENIAEDDDELRITGVVIRSPSIPCISQVLPQHPLLLPTSTTECHDAASTSTSTSCNQNTQITLGNSLFGIQNTEITLEESCSSVQNTKIQLSEATVNIQRCSARMIANHGICNDKGDVVKKSVSSKRKTTAKQEGSCSAKRKNLEKPEEESQSVRSSKANCKLYYNEDLCCDEQSAAADAAAIPFPEMDAFTVFTI